MKRFIRRYSFPIAVIAGAAAFVGGTGLTVSSAWLITVASEHPPIMVLGVSIVLVRFFGISRSGARYLERVISHEAILRKLTSIRISLFQSISSKLQSLNISTSVKAIVDDVERAQEFYLRITLPGYSAAISGVITSGIALWINPIAALWILPVVLIFAFLIPRLVVAWIDPLTIELEILEGAYSEALSGASQAIVEGEVFGYSEQLKSQISQSAADLSALEKRYFGRISYLQALTLLSTATALIGISLTIRNREILPVHISMAIFLVLVGFESYTSWFPNLFIAGKNRRALHNTNALASGKLETKQNKVPGSFDLALKNFSPYWNSPFLRDINVEISYGQTVVISGASGVGKSTLASALFGFTHYQGSATLGGVEIKELQPGLIVGSLQNGHIFNTTLRENLKIAKADACDEELSTLISELELGAIGLDEILGEFGRPLSGGEGKRLATARALLSPAPIVILDEPLEHLDHERAQRVEAVIMKRCVGRTLIVITHAPWLQYSLKLELERE
jgi:ABC-type transport system involved in cytochrome bd biosynthesis fused ATPase/permease subunit